MQERTRAVAKTLAIGVSAGLFALAVAQAQPGCDAGGKEGSAPAKADAPAKAEAPAKAAPVKAEPTAASAEAPAVEPAAASAGAPAVEPAAASAGASAVEPAAASAEAPAVEREAEANAKADASGKRRNAKPRKKDEPDAKVFLPATKSGAFLPRDPPPQQQSANPPANQE